jgi:ubiquinone/menaquinone biosynthesis C-methylase UbiE
MSLKSKPTESFGNIASRYVRHPYPEDMVDALIKQTGIKPGAVIADIGAGNGLLGLALAKHGFHVRMVEPSKEMLELIKPDAALQAKVEKQIGTCERTGLADQSVDLIVAGNAAHWFLDNPEQTTAEFRRILKPGGKAAFLSFSASLEDPFVSDLHNHMLQTLHGYRERPAFVLHERDRTARAPKALMQDGVEPIRKIYALKSTPLDIVTNLETTHTFSQIFAAQPEIRTSLETFANQDKYQGQDTIKYECDLYIGYPKEKTLGKNTSKRAVS